MHISQLASKYKSLEYWKKYSLPQLNDDTLKVRFSDLLDRYAKQLRAIRSALSTGEASPSDQTGSLILELQTLERELQELEKESRLFGRC